MWWIWCRLRGDFDWWEPLYFFLIGDRPVDYLPSFLTCSFEVLWASINLLKVSPRLEIFLSIICNLFSVILLFSWGVHWVRDTDNARESLTLLTDALEILVKESIEGVTTVGESYNFSSSVSDITVMTAVSKTIFQKKISIALLIFIIQISTYLLFVGYSCILVLFTTLVLGSVRSASHSSMKRLRLSRCLRLNERTRIKSKN